MDDVKCVVVGDSGTGKTCLLHCFVNNSFPDTKETTTFNSHTATSVHKGKIFHLNLYDSAGSHDHDDLRSMIYPQTDVFVICFSVIDPTSFSSISSRWLVEINRHCPGVPIVLAGTKIDMREDCEVMKKLSYLQQKPLTQSDGEQKKKEIGAFAYVEVSAMEQKGLKELFSSAADAVMDRGKSAPKKKCVIS